MEQTCDSLQAADAEYTQQLRASLSPFKPGKEDGHVMQRFTPAAAAPLTGDGAALRQRYRDAQASRPAMPHRQIAHTPERILDAPGLRDDFYLNPLDWSSQNVLAVGLGRTVYLWHASSATVQQVVTAPVEGDYIASVKFSADGTCLAVGTATAEVWLYDLAGGAKRSGTIRGHGDRVSSLAWASRGELSTAGRDKTILTHDLRVGAARELRRGHQKEVCGLEYSCDGRSLASGGNDNLLCVWDARSSGKEEPRCRFTQHTAAVKALAWHPSKAGLLASGGGSNDCSIRLWDTERGAAKRSVETASQVCAMRWSKRGDELVTSHGYSQNQLALWDARKLQRIAELTGHHGRALHLALSPDGSTVVSGSPDETLRFWKIFAPDSGGKGTEGSRPLVGTFQPMIR